MSRTAITVRLEPELHERVRVHAFLTKESVNVTVTRLLEEYLAGPGKDAMLAAASVAGRTDLREALDTLGERI